jgi:beta-RFAP synthase
MALVYHGIAPAILEADLDMLRRSIHDLQGVGFKRREIESTDAHVSDILDAVYAAVPTAAVGMSSMGPLVYVVVAADTATPSRAALERICGHEVELQGPFAPQNDAHTIATVETV